MKKTSSNDCLFEGLGSNIGNLGHLKGSSCSPCTNVVQVQGGQSDSYVHLFGDLRYHDIEFLRVCCTGCLEFDSKFVYLGAGWAKGGGQWGFAYTIAGGAILLPSFPSGH
eukprot:7621634-Ditylum_brightwellii.AAC.1